MQIIFVNRYFYPDHSATSQMLGDLAFSLVEQGKNITIITSRLRYDDPQAQLPAYEKIKNVDVFRVYTTRFGRSNLLGRSLDYLTFYIFAVFRLLLVTHRGDIVVAKTDPPLISVVVLPVIWLKRAKLVNWLQDLFPEVAIALGIGQGKVAPFMYILKKLRNLSLRAARTNVVIGELMAQRLRDQNIPDSKITVIPNWADGDLIKPIAHQDNPLRKEWNLKDKFVVGYSGNLGRAHDFSALLAAAAILDKTSPEILFLFIGDGSQRKQIEEEVKRRGVGNIEFKPYQPRERLAESLSAIDLHIVSLKPELEGLIVPSKFYGIAAAGRPTLFVGDEEGEIPRLLEHEGCGVTVRPGDPDNLVRQIGWLASDLEHCRFIGEKVQMQFKQYFDKKIIVSKWKNFIEEAVKEPRQHRSKS